MEELKKENLFKILLMLEKEGWETVQVDSCKDVWFATVIRGQDGLYIEFMNSTKATSGLLQECPICHATEDAICECSSELVFKKDISSDFWIYKQNNN